MWKFSNFQPTPVEFEGVVWPTPEHAYQAAKTESALEKARILNASSPAMAKRLGRKLTLRASWDMHKDDFMLQVLRSKFYQEPYRSQFLATGFEELVEWNTWHDNYWGKCVCLRPSCQSKGKNRLGGALMKIRREIQ